MEIVFEGTGIKEVFPDLVKIRIEFKYLEINYDRALEVGTNSVTEFIENVLPKLELKLEDLRTTKFCIEHVVEKDYRTNNEKDMGYQFEQIANLEFDYDKEKIKITQTIYALWIAE